MLPLHTLQKVVLVDDGEALPSSEPPPLLCHHKLDHGDETVSVVTEYSGSQPVVRGPPVVFEGAPGGPHVNDGDLSPKWAFKDL